MTQEAHTAHALAGAYALDALSEHERRQFEAHLAGCEPCAQEVRGLQETAARLAIAAAQVPPPGLRERVLAEASQVRQLPPRLDPARPRRSRWAPALLTVAAAACLAVAVVLGVSLVRTQDRLDRANDVNAVLTAADASEATQPIATGGTGRVVSSQQLGKAVVIMNGLAELPSSKMYVLWRMKPGSVAPAGSLTPSSPPQVIDIGDADQIGMTAEPASDSLPERPSAAPIFAAPI
jgi:anti-sigma-K factor RskA